MTNDIAATKKILVACFMSLFLTGCVSLRAPSAAASFQVESSQVRMLALQKLTSWNIAGAFSVTKQGKSNIANYTWQQYDPYNYSIHINSALNAYAVNIVGKPAMVTLYQSSKKPLSARSSQQLLQQAIGYSLPIANLYYWIRGMPSPGKFKAQYDSFGHLTHLLQQGWVLTFMRYKHFRQLDVPQLISLHSEQLQLRIVIKKWRKT